MNYLDNCAGAEGSEKALMYLLLEYRKLRVDKPTGKNSQLHMTLMTEQDEPPTNCCPGKDCRSKCLIF